MPPLSRALWLLGQGALQLLYPRLCWACERPLPLEGDSFCPDCRDALTADPFPTCPFCSSTIGPFVDASAGCTRCRDAGHAFSRAVRLGPYDGALRETVLRLKHAGGEGLADAVGRLWADAASDRLTDLRADVVVPVPLHWWRRLRRGYNQAETLARAVARRLQLPCRPLCLRRVRNTPKQTDQTPAGRRANVRGAFRARAGVSLRGRRVLLIDDVLTTGATASEAARALRRAGAADVVVAVLAHDHGR